MTWVRGPPARVGWRVLTHYLSECCVVSGAPVHVVMKPAGTSRNDLGVRASGPRWMASADPFICLNAAWFPAPRARRDEACRHVTQ